MNSMLVLLISAFVILLQPIGSALADDVYVNGYTRSDGTYVRPHVRSAPDSSRANNYGPSQTTQELMNPRTRDYDRDGISNYRDSDDDNDGTWDNNDRSQYGRRR